MTTTEKPRCPACGFHTCRCAALAAKRSTTTEPARSGATVPVRITESVLWDIQGRDLAGHYGIGHVTTLPATVDMPVELARSLADDARYQSDPVDAGGSHSIGLRSAYLALAKRIEGALA